MGGPRASSERYVSLGDSWISGPLIPDLVGNPIDCARSSNNAPSLAARELGIADFVDVSCGGARTVHLHEPQKPALGGLLGIARPQLDALDATTTLVTLGIGGNDVRFPETAIRCANFLPIPLGPPPFGQPCVEMMTAGGVDRVSARIAETRPRIDRALAEIRRRSPGARVFVIGYPGAIPDTGPGCWPQVPILEPDMRYLRDKFKEMNAMLAAAARRAGARFIDTYASSIGHDVCRPTGVAWVNGVTLDPPAFPLHPNGMSHANTARLIVRAVRGR
jgi:hypothetical protein